jgi:hypothetical protein
LQAVATRDSMTKCLYAALFDWIVLQINKSLMSSSDLKAQPVSDAGALHWPLDVKHYFAKQLYYLFGAFM